jgi:hypothetical protein
MTISSTMNLSELAERMGGEATEQNAKIMRDLLVEKFNGEDTRDIPESEWLEMLDQTV